MFVTYLIAVRIRTIYESNQPNYLAHLHLSANETLTHVDIIQSLSLYNELWPCPYCHGQFRVSE